MKKYWRSRDDNWIGGVCGGLSDHTGVDSGLYRIAFVLLFGWGSGWIYLALWVLYSLKKRELPVVKQQKSLEDEKADN